MQIRFTICCRKVHEFNGMDHDSQVKACIMIFRFRTADPVRQGARQIWITPDLILWSDTDEHAAYPTAFRSMIRKIVQHSFPALLAATAEQSLKGFFYSK